MIFLITTIAIVLMWVVGYLINTRTPLSKDTTYVTEICWLIIGCVAVSGYVLFGLFIPINTHDVIIPRAQASIMRTQKDVMVETSRGSDTLTDVPDYILADTATGVVYHDANNSYGLPTPASSVHLIKETK